MNGGRWNPPGQSANAVGILCTAEYPALALVEILVHMPQVPYSELPTYSLFTLEIPDQSQHLLTAEELPVYWSKNTYRRSQTILRDWLADPDVLALGVPSSVMPDGINYLFHPTHPIYSSIRVIE